MFASREGHAAVVDLLLADELDADVDLATNQGINALMCAADAGHVKIAKALIDKHADVNASTNVRSVELPCIAAREGRFLPLVFSALAHSCVVCPVLSCDSHVLVGR